MHPILENSQFNGITTQTMKHIGDTLKERNITLDTVDPVLAGGFTQVPNFILKNPDISLGARIAYALFLSYAWNNDYCFPGQDRLATDMGLTRVRVTQLISELEKAGYITIQRRGLGKTNLYDIHFRVKRPGENPEKSQK